MRAQLRPGLTGYSCARAFLAWNLGVIALYFVLRHYRLVPEFAPRDFGDSGYMVKYLYEVAGRILKDTVFLLPMALILVGCMGYALSLMVAMICVSRRLAGNGAISPKASWSCSVVGLPQISSKDEFSRLAGRGSVYATAPIRDAATLFPAVGFLGTVVGVTIALGGLEQVMAKGDPSRLMNGLLTAFDTTFLGLLASLVLTIVMFAIDSATSQIAALLEDRADNELAEVKLG